MSSKEYVLNVVDDLVSDFLYYDRKGDEGLPIDAIDAMVRKKQITIQEIVDEFELQLTKGLKLK